MTRTTAGAGAVDRRGGARRDRRGRGTRGPAVLPGPLTPAGVPWPGSGRERFDRLVRDVVASLEERWPDQLAALEFAVEDTPLLPDDWSSDAVPLASVIQNGPGGGRRLVVFRRPLELRAETADELGALVLAVVVEQVADLLGRPPEEIDPRYGA